MPYLPVATVARKLPSPPVVTTAAARREPRGISATRAPATGRPAGSVTCPATVTGSAGRSGSRAAPAGRCRPARRQAMRHARKPAPVGARRRRARDRTGGRQGSAGMAARSCPVRIASGVLAQRLGDEVADGGAVAADVVAAGGLDEIAVGDGGALVLGQVLEPGLDQEDLGV